MDKEKEMFRNTGKAGCRWDVRGLLGKPWVNMESQDACLCHALMYVPVFSSLLEIKVHYSPCSGAVLLVLCSFHEGTMNSETIC